MSLRDSESFDSEEALEQLLAQAHWPEPPVERIERLRASWRRLTSGRVRGAGQVWGLMALAAGLLLAAGAACWRWTLPAPPHRGNEVPVIASVEPRGGDGEYAELAALANEQPDKQPGPPDDRSSLPAAQTGVALHRSTAPASAWVRSPNRLEQTLMLSAGWPAPRDLRVTLPRPRLDEAQAAAEPRKSITDAIPPRWGLDRKTLTSRARAARQQCEINLWRVLRTRSATTKAKSAAIGLLGLAGSPRSIPLVSECSLLPELHRPALLALVRLASSDAAAELAAREPESELRRQLWAEALRRASAGAVDRYLRSIERGDTAALPAIAEVRHPPLDALFLALESPHVPLRLAAARALGRINDARVARRLSHYVLENVSRQEALVALLAHRDRYAAAFIEQARDDLRLMAVVEAAKGQLNSFASENWR